VLAVFRLCLTPVRRLYPLVEEVDPVDRRGPKRGGAAEVVGTVKRAQRRKD